MAPSEPSYPATGTPQAQENDLKTNFMKMIEIFNEEMSISPKEIQETTNQHGEQMNNSLKKASKI